MGGEGSQAVGKVAVVWDGNLEYDFGREHPLKPVRVELTMELIHRLNMVDGDAVVEVTSDDFSEEELRWVHRDDYIETVKAAGRSPSMPSAWEYGLGPGDNPVFYGMHEASMQVCAASKQAARMVWEGEADHAFNPAGGLHHAMPRKAAGFCIYNDPAVAIEWLLHNGAERIAYVDVDVHHGDGVEQIFWDDPRVLTVSLHEAGNFLFPGTGWPDDKGGEGAEGSAANVPLHPGTTGDIWLDAFDQAVEPLVRAFEPDALVTQLGCDTHFSDPLAHLALTTNDYRRIAQRLHRLAHESAGGRWIATGGGGYQVVRVVPRAWTIHFAEMSGFELPEEVPQDWRDTARERVRKQDPPETFWDGSVEVGGNLREKAREAARQSIGAVRELIFPHHGVQE